MSELKQNMVNVYLKAKHIWPEILAYRFRECLFNIGDNVPALSKHIDNFLKYDHKSTLISYLIKEFTLGKKSRSFDINEVVKYVKQCNGDNIRNIELKNNLLKIETKDNMYNVGKLSEFFGGTDDEILLSNDRVGVCHQASIMTGLRIKDDSCVVTGKVWTLCPQEKFLHSWVEIPRNGKDDLVIDYTINSIINKSGYYALNHIDEDNVHKIDINEIAEDVDQLDLYKGKYTYLLKEYLTGNKEFAKKLYDFGGPLEEQEMEN